MAVSQATATINGKPLTFETGKFAKQAGGAVTVRYGDTIVFAAGTVAKTTRPGIDFFPLTADFEERLYAAGKIPGSFPRREGRPSEEGILTARLVCEVAPLLGRLDLHRLEENLVCARVPFSHSATFRPPPHARKRTRLHVKNAKICPVTFESFAGTARLERASRADRPPDG